jgi:DNA-binding transcriptional regulator YiaG
MGVALNHQILTGAREIAWNRACYDAGMSPEELKQLRQELGCSLGELSASVEVDVKTLLAWESGDLFPTKKHVDRLLALKQAGQSAVVRRVKRGKPASGLDALDDPRLWAIVKKLASFPEFLSEVEKLASRYGEETKA